MSFDTGNRFAARTAVPQVGIDQGLRSYMLRVYNYMGGALAVTGLVAWFSQGLVAQLAQQHSPLMYLLIFAPLGFVLVLSFGIQRMSLGAAQATFWGYAAVMGLSMSTIFLVYTYTSIAQMFFITAVTFLAMSLWGYTTKRDLAGMGHFLFMGLIGVVIASVVNIFLRSPGLQFAVSVIGVLVFTGLTAWDTQRIKEMYWDGDSAVIAGKKAIMGALALYLDFVNLFMFLLQLFGQRRD
ncbi:MAG: Bax inhibitor-1/YccA family protein [Alphaproteobacteria bacterium]|nr:Bax inhibitor-1/YccA family protein [Alphaproteobacteria bacterium]